MQASTFPNLRSTSPRRIGTVSWTSISRAFSLRHRPWLRAMIPQGEGKIVNIASQMGVVGGPKRAAYCAAKAGVVNLTRVLAFEWRKYKINVNAVGPTFVETPLTKPMFEDLAFKEDVLARIPLGRLAK